MSTTDEPIVKNRRDRLRLWINKSCKGKQSVFIEKTGINQSELSLLLKTKSFGEKKARKLEIEAGMPKNYLDQIEPIKADFINGEVFHPDSNAKDKIQLGIFKNVPVVGVAELCDNGQTVKLERELGAATTCGIIKFSSVSKKSYAIKCIGNAMRPRIRDGEYVIIDPFIEALPGSEVLITLTDGLVMIMTLLYISNDRAYLMSVNESFHPKSYLMSDIESMHSVTGIAKEAHWIEQ